MNSTARGCSIHKNLLEDMQERTEKEGACLQTTVKQTNNSASYKNQLVEMPAGTFV